MRKTLLAFHPSHPKGVRWQIADYLRTLIAAGELTADQQLPATNILVRQWGTNVATVQGAMSLLVKEGLIWRAPKRGTFVRKREARLTQVAVYYSEDALFLPTYGYRPALHRQIKDVLSRDGIATAAWIDPRPIGEQNTVWYDLQRAANERRVQGVVVLGADWPHVNWILKLPVPSALLSTANLPNAVVGDGAAFMTLAVDALAARGCRSLGLICYAPEETNPDGSPHDDTRTWNAFTTCARKAGMVVRNAWIRAMPRSGDPSRGEARIVAEDQRYGYESFHAIWDRASRPDGLIVTNDVVSMGVMAAMFEAGVRGGRDVHLALHRNSDVEVFCPMPATLIEFKTRTLAETLVTQLQRQWRGESIEKVYVQPAVRQEEPRVRNRNRNRIGERS
jgi:DNA-binding LacI/PurR family transcriptional regulator/DNA-binding transcriptional regulator YhcF (GntR family)